MKRAHQLKKEGFSPIFAECLREAWRLFKAEETKADQATATDHKGINKQVRESLIDFYRRLSEKGIDAIGKRLGDLQDYSGSYRMIGPIRYLMEKYNLARIAIECLEWNIACDFYDLTRINEVEIVKNEIAEIKSEIHKAAYITCDKPIPMDFQQAPEPVKPVKPKPVKSILAKHDQSPALKPVSKTKEAMQVGSFLAVAAGIGSALTFPVMDAFSVTGLPLFEVVSLPFALLSASTIAGILVVGERG